MVDLRQAVRVAESQHGLITARQLDEAGLSRHDRRRLVDTGQVRIKTRGVYVLGAVQPSPHQRVMSAVLGQGEDAHASHVTAAWVWGAARSPRILDVTVLALGSSRRDVRLHRSLFDAGRTIHDGIPVSTPCRTLGELGAVAPQGQVEACLDNFLGRGLVTAEDVLDWRLTHGGRGRRGIGVLGRVLTERLIHGELSDSKLEAAFHKLLVLAGLDQFDYHLNVEGYEVDFAHVPARVIIEVDGWKYHSSRDAFVRDRWRDATLAANGWIVLRFTWRQVIEQPNGVIARVRATLQQRAAA